MNNPITTMVAKVLYAKNLTRLNQNNRSIRIRTLFTHSSNSYSQRWSAWETVTQAELTDEGDLIICGDGTKLPGIESYHINVGREIDSIRDIQDTMTIHTSTIMLKPSSHVIKHHMVNNVISRKYCSKIQIDVIK